MSTLDNNLKFIKGGFVNGRQREGLHPKVRQLFLSWETACRNQGLELKFYSGYRSRSHQSELRNDYLAGRSKIYASPPGYSSHELGLAMDTYVWNGKSFTRNKSMLKKVAAIGKQFGLRWGGNFKVGNEQHHFDYSFGLGFTELRKLAKAGKIDENGYVLADDSEVTIPKNLVVAYDWSTDLGIDTTIYTDTESDKVLKKPTPTIKNVEKIPAQGIWQIIKMRADRWSLAQTVADSSIANSQGSLINYIKKVAQDPWMQFWGDTIGDQFYFNARRAPFDYNGWSLLMDQGTISSTDVIADDLKWYNGPIYSWYQIIPKGSFISDESQIFAHVTAVFFEEYAQVFGSKPNSQVSNYLTFLKQSSGKKMFDKALEDLRYMVESNMYLPFTREGTITIKGMRPVKRGYKIHYWPTNEEFYVDGVQHRFTYIDGSAEWVTTIQVSRGVEKAHSQAPKTTEENNYWNLILFDDPPPKIKIEKEKIKGDQTEVYFDNNRNYLIDLNEKWPPATDTVDKKMETQIKEFPELRKELVAENKANIEYAVAMIEKYPECPTFRCVGYIDSDKGGNNSTLPKNRAKTLKNAIVDAYMEKHPSESKSALENKISLVPKKVKSYSKEEKKAFGDTTKREFKRKAKQRIAFFIMDEWLRDKEVEEPVKGVNWKVNDPVFKFFLKRKQFSFCRYKMDE